MNDSLYFFLVRILAWFVQRGLVIGSENLPSQGPAVIVANHLGPEGPIDTICSIHLRFYPWIVEDMVVMNLAAEYLRYDFVEPSLGIRPPFSRLVSRLISLISVPLLSSFGCVPVNRDHYGDIQGTLQISIELLKKEKILLIFPEAPELVPDSLTKMKPFLKGFTRLSELYYANTGKTLSFYPVAVHESKKIMVGKSIPGNPDIPHSQDRIRLKANLESEIQKMYIEMNAMD